MWFVLKVMCLVVKSLRLELNVKWSRIDFCLKRLCVWAYVLQNLTCKSVTREDLREQFVQKHCGEDFLYTNRASPPPLHELFLIGYMFTVTLRCRSKRAMTEVGLYSPCNLRCLQSLAYAVPLLTKIRVKMNNVNTQLKAATCLKCSLKWSPVSKETEILKKELRRNLHKLCISVSLLLYKYAGL